MQLTVNFVPVADFNIVERCVPAEGGLVQFQNTSDTGSSQSVTWQWNFEYPSSLGEDRSTLKDPTHLYDTGSYTVTLKVRNENCDDQAEEIVNIRPKPEADFTA